MAVLLAKELKALGFDRGEFTLAEFRDVVQEVFAVLHPSWTDEELLFNPHDALRFCDAVRCRTCLGIPDNFILRTLVNVRKHALADRG
jgi:hypothetical protein